MKSRLLLISVTIGFSFSVWSYIELPPDRPLVFAPLRLQIHFAANSHLISDEAREFLIAKETEAAQAQGRRTQQTDFSYGISVAGLLVVSCIALAAYQQSSPRA